MMRVLLRKEMLAIARDGRMLLLALSVIAVFIAVLSVSMQERRERQGERDRVGASAREQWDKQGAKHPHRGAHFGIYVFRPESVLVSFDPGLNRFAGQALWLEPHRRNAMRFSDASDDTVSTRFASLTPAFVLTAVLPLLILAMGFNAVAHERELGTLRMQGGLGLRGHAFLWSKYAALFAICAVILGAAFGVGALLAGPGELDPPTLLRAGLSFVFYLLYYAVLIALALAVSARMRTSRGALALLLGLWIAFVFVLPRVGASAASQLVRLPSAESFWSAIKHDYQHGLPGDGGLAARDRQFDQQLMRDYAVQRLEDIPAGAYALRRLNRDAYADKVHALHFKALHQRMLEQERILAAVAILSPTVWIRSLSMRMAGTDLAHLHHFEEAAETYRRYFNTRIDAWDAANSKGLASFDDKYASDSLWQSIAAFSYRPPGAGQALDGAAIDAAAMAGWVIAGLLLLSQSARRLQW